MKLETNARYRKNGAIPYVQAYVRVHAGLGGMKYQRFAMTSTRAERDAWRRDMVLRFGQRVIVTASFADKVQQYLAQHQAKATIGQATAHLELWLHALGRDRDPLSVTREEINAVMDGWMTPPERPPASQLGEKGMRGRPALACGLKPGTVRKRRMWLRQFYVWLTGHDGGPCQKANNPKPAPAAARGIDYVTIENAINSMPRYRSAKKGASGPLSLARIRARVLFYSGLPPGLLMQVKPNDLNFRDEVLYVLGRDKGEGVEERELPMVPEAISAWKEFHAANAYGPFSISSLGRSLKQAFRRVGYTRHVKLYDARHSFGTFAYRVTGDEATVARLMMHAEGSPMTARYTRGAHADVDREAVKAFSAALVARRQAAIKPVPAARKPPR